MAIKEVSSSKCFEGYQKFFSHFSEELGCETKFGVYIPPETEKFQKFPVLYWLSGLRYDDERFSQQSGVQKYASQHGIMIVCPDTTPRNTKIPIEGVFDELGFAPGFYVDAIKDPWSKHFRMYSYVTKELIKIVEENFPIIPDKRSVAGHSMGGHGALICALKNPEIYRSVSSLAPVANPIKAPLARHIFKTFLGDDEETWKMWDATELARKYCGPPMKILIDQGTNDSYYEEKQLLPENFVEAASANERLECSLKMREGYDHSANFIMRAIEEHIVYHAQFLKD